MCNPMAWILLFLAFAAFLTLAMILEDEGKCAFFGLLTALVFAFPIFAPYGVLFCEDSIHDPYTITGTVLKIDKNEYGEYEPTVTLDGGEKVKVKEDAKTLYQFIGSNWRHLL